MKRTRIALKIVTFAIILSMLLCSLSVLATAAGEYDISSQDSIQFAAGLNASNDELIYELNDKSYHIFDYEKAAFKNLFRSRKNPEQKTISITGSSRAEFSSEFAEKRSNSTSMGVDAPVPVGNVSANIGAQFDTDISKGLTSINEEYYEYFEYYNRTRIITAYWEENDLSNLFRASFLNEYNSIDNQNEAKAFLEKYGTHLFRTYYMGGSLVITKYVASEESISATYEGSNKVLSLEANVSNAAQTASEGSKSALSSNNVNNSTTKTKNDMTAYGGGSMNAMTVDDLFAYNQEYAAGQGSGFVYKHWMETLEKGINEVVINAAEPIAIWELMGAKYGNAKTNNLLKDAFDMMCFENYAKLCRENDINSDLIGKISYTSSNIDVSFTVSGDTIFLPAGATVTLDYGTNITANNLEADTSFKVIGDSSVASIVDSNKIKISSNANEKTFKVNILMGSNVIQTLNVEVKRGSYTYAEGYGTKDQPYVIANANHWNALANSCTEYKYYILANDIDLGGEFFEPIGMRRGETFNGHLDGNGKTIRNFTVVPKSNTACENVGIFAVNAGTIKNLAVENVKCLTNLLVSTNHDINSGILVGKNAGTIDNVFVRDSAIRASAELASKTDAKLNVGTVCGYASPYSNTTNLGVVNCNVYGISVDKGIVNVGGAVGKISGTEINNCYVYDSKINVKNQNKENQYAIGSILGDVAEYSSTQTVDGEEKTIVLKPTVSNCVSNNNTLNQNTDNYGYVAGKAYAYSEFKSCYYAGTAEKSVSGKPTSGCELVKNTSTLNNKVSINPDWVQKDEKIILSSHLDMVD